MLGASNQLALTLSSNLSEEESVAGLLQVYPLASFSGRFRGSLVLVFRATRPIRWRWRVRR
jgi:hypothetical protein